MKILREKNGGVNTQQVHFIYLFIFNLMRFRWVEGGRGSFFTCSGFIIGEGEGRRWRERLTDDLLTLLLVS